MKRIAFAVSLLLAFTATLSRAAPQGRANCYDWITRDKIRGGYLSSSDLGDGLARMRAVGMNTLMPKFGELQAPPTVENVQSLRDWGRAARQSGFHLFPVINFRGGAERLLNDRREVTVIGETMKLTPCPLDEAFWNLYIRGRMVYLAEHGHEFGLAGAILDPEMYGADHTSFDSVCYCADCLREFCRATGCKIPNPLPPPADRAAWLKRHGLQQRFEQHFVDRVQGFCQRIERECHAKNPVFLLGMLHPDIEGPFTRGLVMGLGIARYPLLGFSEMTYSTGYTNYIAKQQRTFASMPAHVLFVPGLWQQQFPSENLAEQYYTCATHSAGYWIYTFESLLEDATQNEGYMLREPADRYWAAMTTANKDLDRWMTSGGTYLSPLKVRSFDPPLPLLGTADIRIEGLVPAPDAQPLSLGPLIQPRLRYRNPLFILAKADAQVMVMVTNLQLASYRSGSEWVVAGPDGTRLAEGHLKVRESAEVKFTPDKDGIYLLVVASGNNSQRLEILTGQRYAYVATEKHPFTVNGVFGRMYFYVPQGVGSFRFFVKAEGQAPGRGGKLTVFGPDGKAAAHLEGDLGSLTEMPVQVPAEAQGRVWCLSAEELTNDLTVYFSPNLTSPYFTPDPAKMLARTEGKW